MRVLVDTPIWSLALRRRKEDLCPADVMLVDTWEDLVRAGRVVIFGPIRQEILSGVRRLAEFERLRRALEPFEDLSLVAEDYVQAARFYNHCRTKGVAATAIDLLICAAACRHSAAVFTTDGDFKRYARHVPIHLFV